MKGHQSLSYCTANGERMTEIRRYNMIRPILPEDPLVKNKEKALEDKKPQIGKPMVLKNIIESARISEDQTYNLLNNFENPILFIMKVCNALRLIYSLDVTSPLIEKVIKVVAICEETACDPLAERFRVEFGTRLYDLKQLVKNNSSLTREAVAKLRKNNFYIEKDPEGNSEESWSLFFDKKVLDFYCSELISQFQFSLKYDVLKYITDSQLTIQNNWTPLFCVDYNVYALFDVNEGLFHTKKRVKDSFSFEDAEIVDIVKQFNGELNELYTEVSLSKILLENKRIDKEYGNNLNIQMNKFQTTNNIDQKITVVSSESVDHLKQADKVLEVVTEHYEYSKEKINNLSNDFKTLLNVINTNSIDKNNDIDRKERIREASRICYPKYKLFDTFSFFETDLIKLVEARIITELDDCIVWEKTQVSCPFYFKYRNGKKQIDDWGIILNSVFIHDGLERLKKFTNLINSSSPVKMPNDMYQIGEVIGFDFEKAFYES